MEGDPLSFISSTFCAKGPSIYYVRKGIGGVGSEKRRLLLTFSTIDSNIGVVQKLRGQNEVGSCSKNAFLCPHSG